MRSLIALLALVAVAHAAVPADLITSLPGWGTTPTKQYSGFLDAQGGKHLHYWLVESENDPANDPVVFWFNGGPGCSSLEGYLYEQGPFHVVEPIVNVSGVPKLYENEYRWNKIANVVFMEAPAGVGFSYADTPAGYMNNDTQQAIDNFNALKSFYASYPEYSSNPLFITGESYAGMYVPTLALQIMQHNAQGAKIPIAGIMVGNGVLGIGAQEPNHIYVNFYYGHGLFPEALYKQIQAVCGDYSNVTNACQTLLLKMHSYIGGVNIYDIYKPCINSMMDQTYSHGFVRELGERLYSKRPANSMERMLHSNSPNTFGPVECIDGFAGAVYLNTPAVRKALHVEAAHLDKWHVCGGKLQYNVTRSSLLPEYPKIIDAMRVLIYNGDVDACIPYNGNEEWTSGLGIPLKEDWRAWTVNSQVGGYVTTYDKGFMFATVKGSGHMVPQFRPAPALHLFESFVKNQPL